MNSTGTTLFTVLHVCTANACRSPLGEYLMRSALQGRVGPDLADRVRVVSAGVHADHNGAIDHGAGELLRRRRIETRGFRSRPLTAELVAEAGLILTATRAHRPEVLRRQPAAARRTFTYAEFGGVVPWVDPDELPDGDIVARATAIVVAADASRSGRRAPAGSAAPIRALPFPVAADTGSQLDLDDPSGGDPEAYEVVGDLVDSSLRPFLHLLSAPYERPAGSESDRSGAGRTRYLRVIMERIAAIAPRGRSSRRDHGREKTIMF
jgi:protein-tyrosine phosphatase